MEEWSATMVAMSGSTKERMQALDELTEKFRRGDTLEREQLCELVDSAGQLLSDNNYKVAQATLQIFQQVAKTDPEAVRPILPLAVERLGDARQQVRQEACELLLTMFSTLPAEYMLERLSRFWTHRAWKVRHGILQTVAEAISSGMPGIFASKTQTTYLITQAVNLLEDSNEAVREAAIECLQEMYRVLGTSLVDHLRRQSIRPAIYKEMVAKLDDIEPTGIVVQDIGAPPAPAPTGATSSGGAAAGSNTRRSDTGSIPDVAGEGPGGRRTGPRESGSNNAGSAGASTPAPIHVASEQDLAHELEAMVVPLTGTVADWQQRVGLLQRLRGLTLGCSPHLFESLVEGLRQLREPLVSQVEDRRSAVSKLACAALATMSSILGNRFAEHLLYFLPVLFRIVPITVQVMAEAADSCIQAMLNTCQTTRAIPYLASAAIKDKSARVRHCCCKYIAHIVQQWEPTAVMRSSEELENVMKAAIQDASGDTRLAARNIYLAYQQVSPDAAAGFLRKLEPALVTKLCKGAGNVEQAPVKKAPMPKLPIPRPKSAAARPAESNDIIVMVPPARPSTTQPPPAVLPPTSTASGQRSYNTSDSGAPVSAVRTSASRKSLAAPIRVADSLYDAGGPDSSGPANPEVAKPSNRVRRASVSAYGGGLQQGLPVRLKQTAEAPEFSGAAPVLPTGTEGSKSYTTTAGVMPPRHSVGVMQAHTAVAPAARSSADGFNISAQTMEVQQQPASSSRSVAEQPTSKASISKSMTVLLAGGKPWDAKVELLSSITNSLIGYSRIPEGSLTISTSCVPSDVQQDMGRLCNKLPEMLDDPHHKVAMAALGVVLAIMRACPRAIDASIERILPSVFSRQQDPKEQVRSTAADVLQEVAAAVTIDTLLPSVMRSLETNKQPKNRTCIMQFAASYLASHRLSGLSPAISSQARQWVLRVAPMLTDKNPDLRKHASEAVEAVYKHVDPAIVHSCAQHCTGADGMALRKLLADLESSRPDCSTIPGLTCTQVPSTLQSGAPGSMTSSLLQSSRPQYQQPTSSVPSAEVGSQSPGESSRSSPLADPRSHPILLTHESSAEGPLAASSSMPRSAHAPTSEYQSVDHPSSSKVEPSQHTLDNSWKAFSNPSMGSSQPGAAMWAAAGPRTLSDPGQAATALATAGIGQPTMMMITSSISAAGNPYAQARGPHLGAFPGPPAASSSAGGPLVPAEPAAQIRLLSLLTHRLSASPSLDTITQLADATNKVAESAWQASLGALLPVVVHKVAPVPDSSVRVMVMTLLTRLAQHHGRLLQTPHLLDMLLGCVISMASDANREVALAADQALQALVDAAQPLSLLSIMQTYLPQDATSMPADGGDTLCVACSAIQRVVHTMAAGGLSADAAATLMPRLAACADHHRVDVRKAAVFAIAETWNALGNDRFSPFMSMFSQTHQRLISWALGRLTGSHTSTVAIA